MLGTDNGRIRCRFPSTDSAKSALAGTGYGEAACAGGLDTSVWGPDERAGYWPRPCSSWRSLPGRGPVWRSRSEEHTSELQSRVDLVCRLLLEKKKQKR